MCAALILLSLSSFELVADQFYRYLGCNFEFLLRKSDDEGDVYLYRNYRSWQMVCCLEIRLMDGSYCLDYSLKLLNGPKVIALHVKRCEERHGNNITLKKKDLTQESLK